MKNFFLVLIGFFLCVSISCGQMFIEESTQADTIKPEIDILPSAISVPAPEGNFILEDFKVLNRGGGELKITKIEATCACANGKVLQSRIMPLTSGKIQLTINMDGLDAEHRTVDFAVYSNAVNSPFMVRIVVENPPVEEKKECEPSTTLPE